MISTIDIAGKNYTADKLVKLFDVFLSLSIALPFNQDDGGYEEEKALYHKLCNIFCLDNDVDNRSIDILTFLINEGLNDHLIVSFVPSTLLYDHDEGYYTMYQLPPISRTIGHLASIYLTDDNLELIPDKVKQMNDRGIIIGPMDQNVHGEEMYGIVTRKGTIRIDQ